MRRASAFLVALIGGLVVVFLSLALRVRSAQAAPSAAQSRRLRRAGGGRSGLAPAIAYCPSGKLDSVTGSHLLLPTLGW